MDNSKNAQKEVDLLELFRKFFDLIGKFINWIFNFLLRVVSYLTMFLFRKWLVIAIFIVIGTVLGGLKYYSGDKVVVSDMVIRNNEVGNEDLITILNELKIYAEQENTKALAQKTGLDSISASNLKFVEGYWFVDSDYDGVADYVDFKKDFNQLEDTTLRRISDELNIRVKVKDPTSLPKVQEGILHFLRHNSLLQRLNKNRLASLNGLVEKTAKELNELDSLQGYEYFVKDQEAELNLGSLGSLRLQGEEKDTRLLHEQVLGLEQKRISYERELNVHDDIVTVISGFAISMKPERTFTFSIIYSGFWVGFIAYIVMFLAYHRKEIIKFLEEKSK